MKRKHRTYFVFFLSRPAPSFAGCNLGYMKKREEENTGEGQKLCKSDFFAAAPYFFSIEKERGREGDSGLAVSLETLAGFGVGR